MTELMVLAALWIARLEPLLKPASSLPEAARLMVQSSPPSLPDTNVTPLQSGDRITDLSDTAHGIRRFVLDVPEDTARLEVHVYGGTGDADLYLRAGAPPDLRSFDHRPFVDGNHESVWIDDPEPGPWHLMLHAYRPYKDVTLTALARHHDRDPAAGADLSTPDLELSLYYELSGITLDQETWSQELRNQVLRDEGRVAFTNGDYDRAISLWTRWSELDPHNPEAVSLIGDTYLRMEETERAIEFYRKSLRIQPGQVTLMVRLARLLDQQLDKPAEARNLLNLYSRVFPYHPEIALAQAEWLLRRRRFDEATQVVEAVIKNDPENLQARTLLHGLLRSPKERFDNLKAMLAVGETPGMQWILAQAIQDHQLMTRPESWIMMDFIDRMRFEAPSRAQRAQFNALMPRDEPAGENFRLGRMSRSWISSQEQQWNEEGSLVLSADPQQTEAYLRLDRSDTMHNGFIEATIEATRGFFWLYARRGHGNMIRFGFDDTGMMYQQIWMNDHLLSNQMRLWSRPDGSTTLRLEIRADGVFTSIDGRPAFSAPLTIPRDMGLGWWGLAPWSPDFGRAAVTIRNVSGGPLPPQIGLESRPRPVSPGGLADAVSESSQRTPRRTDLELDQLQNRIQTLSMLAPDWYRTDWTGRPRRLTLEDDTELRLLARFYRVRLLPRLTYSRPDRIPWDHLAEIARRDRVDGFTLLLHKMPEPEALRNLEDRLFDSDLDFVLLVNEPDQQHILLYEIKPGVSLLPGPRRPVRLPVKFLQDFKDSKPHTVPTILHL